MRNYSTFLALFVAINCAVHGDAASLEEKVLNLEQSVGRNGAVMQMDVRKWNSYVKASPRNYSVVVLFTTLAAHVPCTMCKLVTDEFFVLANSHAIRSDREKSLYFAMVDYASAQQVFKSVGSFAQLQFCFAQLGVQRMPELHHFPPKFGAKRAQDALDLERKGFDADSMAAFVRARTGVHIPIHRPPNYALRLAILTAASFAFAILYACRNVFLNRTFFGMACSMVVFTFLSGQMWNFIRAPPYRITNPRNPLEAFYVYPSIQFQLLSETGMVFSLYVGITLGVLMLNSAAAKKRRSALMRKILAFGGLGLVVVLFSALISVYAIKNGGYPYRMLFN